MKNNTICKIFNHKTKSKITQFVFNLSYKKQKLSSKIQFVMRNNTICFERLYEKTQLVIKNNKISNRK